MRQAFEKFNSLKQVNSLIDAITKSEENVNHKLALAIEFERYEIALWLIQELKADPLILPEDQFHTYGEEIQREITKAKIIGYTPLMLACYNGQEKVVEGLLNAGAEVMTLTPAGFSLLSLTKDERIRKIILKKPGVFGGDRLNTEQLLDLYATDNDFKNLLEIAANSKFRSIAMQYAIKRNAFSCVQKLFESYPKAFSKEKIVEEALSVGSYFLIFKLVECGFLDKLPEPTSELHQEQYTKILVLMMKKYTIHTTPTDLKSFFFMYGMRLFLHFVQKIDLEEVMRKEFLENHQLILLANTKEIAELIVKKIGKNRLIEVLHLLLSKKTDDFTAGKLNMLYAIWKPGLLNIVSFKSDEIECLLKLVISYLKENLNTSYRRDGDITQHSDNFPLIQFFSECGKKNPELLAELVVQSCNPFIYQIFIKTQSVNYAQLLKYIVSVEISEESIFIFKDIFLNIQGSFLSNLNEDEQKKLNSYILRIREDLVASEDKDKIADIQKCMWLHAYPTFLQHGNDDRLIRALDREWIEFDDEKYGELLNKALTEKLDRFLEKLVMIKPNLLRSISLEEYSADWASQKRNENILLKIAEIKEDLTDFWINFAEAGFVDLCKKIKPHKISKEKLYAFKFSQNLEELKKQMTCLLSQSDQIETNTATEIESNKKSGLIKSLAQYYEGEQALTPHKIFKPFFPLIKRKMVEDWSSKINTVNSERGLQVVEQEIQENKTLNTHRNFFSGLFSLFPPKSRSTLDQKLQEKRVSLGG